MGTKNQQKKVKMAFLESARRRGVRKMVICFDGQNCTIMLPKKWPKSRPLTEGPLFQPPHPHGVQGAHTVLLPPPPPTLEAIPPPPPPARSCALRPPRTPATLVSACPGRVLALWVSIARPLCPPAPSGVASSAPGPWHVPAISVIHAHTAPPPPPCGPCWLRGPVHAIVPAFPVGAPAPKNAVPFRRRRRGGTSPGPPAPPPPLRTAKILLRCLQCQEDLCFKIVGPPSAGTIGGPSEEGGVPAKPPSPLPPDKAPAYHRISTSSISSGSRCSTPDPPPPPLSQEPDGFVTTK